MRGIHRSPVISPHKGHWRCALIFSLICTLINSWVNNREAGDLKRHRAHYDVTLMVFMSCRMIGYHSLYLLRLLVVVILMKFWLNLQMRFYFFTLVRPHTKLVFPENISYVPQMLPRLRLKLIWTGAYNNKCYWLRTIIQYITLEVDYCYSIQYIPFICIHIHTHTYRFVLL